MSTVRRNGNGRATAAHGRDAVADAPRKSNGHGRTMDAPFIASIPNALERPDEQLLLAYRQGDKAAFTQLMARYQRELFHFLVRFLGDRAAAEDVFQETFLQVHQSAEQFDTS